jgi:chromatin remodeling complex protein RSC6
MFFSTCKWVIISLLLIFLIHHLSLFLINTLTIPKIKDLVNKPNEEYNDMFASLSANIRANNISKTNKTNNNNANPNETDTSAMTNELNAFLKDIKKTTDTNKKSTTDLYPADEGMGGGAFTGSNYTPY